METAGNTRDAVGGLDAGNGAIRPPGCHKSGVTGGFLGVGGQAWAPGAGLQAGACTQQVTRKHRVLSATRPLTPRHQTSTVETGSLWSVKGPRPCPAPTRFPPLRPRPPSPRPRPFLPRSCVQGGWTAAGSRCPRPGFAVRVPNPRGRLGLSCFTTSLLAVVTLTSRGGQDAVAPRSPAAAQGGTVSHLGHEDAEV